MVINTRTFVVTYFFLLQSFFLIFFFLTLHVTLVVAAVSYTHLDVYKRQVLQHRGAGDQRARPFLQRVIFCWPPVKCPSRRSKNKNSGSQITYILRPSSERE